MIPAELLSAKRWLIYTLEPQPPRADGTPRKPRKVPRYFDGTPRSGDLSGDADRLVTYEQACSAAVLHQAGLGFALGADGRGGCFQGVDLDAVNERPALAALQLPSYLERSPSGTGVHAIGYGAPFDALGPNKSGIECYSRDRFFTFSGQALSSGPIVDLWPYVRDVLRPLHAAGRRAPGAISDRPALATDDRQLAELADALRFLDADDRETWIAAGQALRNLGEPGYRLWAAWSATSARFPGGDDLERWNTFRGDRSGPGAIFARATAQGWKNPRALDLPTVFGGTVPAAPPTIPPVPERAASASIEDFHAYMPAHQYVYGPTGDLWPASSVDGAMPWPIGPTGKPQKPSAWLDQNRAVAQLTWSPGEPKIISDRLVHLGGWIDRPGARVINVYVPPPTLSGDASAAGLYLEHLHRVYPDEAAHLVQWFAHRLQRPHEKVNHAIVLGGSQGIGKDTLLEPVKIGVGAWNFHEVSPAQMLGRFNGWAKSTILRVSEVRDLGEANRFAFYDHTKTLIAAPPDVLRVDEKNLREHYVVNVMGVVFTTNNKTDGLYLPADDRRHFVAWSELHREDFDASYWQRLWGWYGSGGIGHVVAYLRALDLSNFDPKAPPPKTRAFWALVQASEAPEASELRDAIEALGNVNAFTLDDLVNAARDRGMFDAVAELSDRRQRRSLPHRLDRAGFVAVRNPTTSDGRWKCDGRNVVVYGRNGLSLADQIRAVHERVRGPRSPQSP